MPLFPLWNTSYRWWILTIPILDYWRVAEQKNTELPTLPSDSSMATWSPYRSWRVSKAGLWKGPLFHHPNKGTIAGDARYLIAWFWNISLPILSKPGGLFFFRVLGYIKYVYVQIIVVWGCLHVCCFPAVSGHMIQMDKHMFATWLSS